MKNVSLILVLTRVAQVQFLIKHRRHISHNRTTVSTGIGRSAVVKEFGVKFELFGWEYYGLYTEKPDNGGT